MVMRATRLLLPILAAAAMLAAAACDGDDAAQDGTPAPSGSASAVTRSVPQIAEEDGLTVVEIAQKLAPSIVRVQTETATIDFLGRTVPSQGVGTGVIIDDDGHIVTNNHVVTVGNGSRPADRITVTLADQQTAQARIVGRDQATDLAVIKIETGDVTAASWGDPAELQVGQGVVAIGFALGIEGAPTVTRGVISAKNRTIQEQPYTIPDAIQTDAGINPGNSGGPLVNARGEIVGINTAIARGAQNIGFAISVGLVRPTVDTLIREGKVERAYLGVGTVDVTDAIARAFGMPVDFGVAVTMVAEGSPADAAGFAENDVIVSVDGEDIRNNGEFLALLARHQPGDEVTVEYYRGNERRSTQATLAERPDA